MNLVFRIPPLPSGFPPFPPGDPQDATPYYNLACVHARMGDARGSLAAKSACQWLAEAIWMDAKFRSIAQADPAFDPIRQDACFQALLREG